MFDLKVYGNFSLLESFNLPIGLRSYFVQRLEEKMERERKDLEQINRK
jgi:hypothetical protein